MVKSFAYLAVNSVNLNKGGAGMQYTKEECRQIASDWFNFHQGKMDLSGMTDEEKRALFEELTGEKA